MLLRRAPILQTYAVCFLVWTAVGLLYFGQDVTRRLYSHDPVPWQEAGFWAVRIYLSAALTPGVLWLGRRWPLTRHLWVRRAGLHLLLAVGFALLRAGLETAVHTWVDALPGAPAGRSVADTAAILLIFGFHEGVLTYWVILAIQSAIGYYGLFQDRELRASQLEAQVAQARLSALKMQLQPHFLFNTLNATVVLVRQRKTQEAEETLTRFSDLLRSMLDDMQAQEVPLARELEHLRLYLSIEQMRFSDRLRVDIDVAAELLDAAVPHMALQPIVENAVRHGIGRRIEGGTIRIEATRAADRLIVIVKDDGPGVHGDAVERSGGIGLANTKARLRQLYGAAAELQIVSGEGGGTAVTLSLPYRSQPSASVPIVAAR
jgi:signal transduction histidine kinase